MVTRGACCEVMSGMEERSPTTTASERTYLMPSAKALGVFRRGEVITVAQSRLRLQLLKSGSAPDEVRLCAGLANGLALTVREPIEEPWHEEPWDASQSSHAVVDPKISACTRSVPSQGAGADAAPPWVPKAWAAWEAEPKQRRRRRRRGPTVGAEGHQTPSTVASDNERQACRRNSSANYVAALLPKRRRAKNGDVRIFDRI
ncbi:hypothetical protein AK812_SmicGene9444 [Symbiodinium microadriaticum]|uniref:Uncharacterized protein n=1 Tax=Symbiodinium microadriaticum TaxID=2951 RepID=A0A1Q9EID5_SYMMI|nr:hypothetical protein AK812_SmicGene9444 [Symbiodinium microadriaticum]